MSDHSRATPLAACAESVPNGEGLGSGLTVAGPPSTTAAGHARLAAGDGLRVWTRNGYPADRSPVVGNHNNVTLP